MTYGKTWHEGRAVRHHNLVAATQPPITGPIDRGKGKSNTAGKGKGKPKSPTATTTQFGLAQYDIGTATGTLAIADTDLGATPKFALLVMPTHRRSQDPGMSGGMGISFGMTDGTTTVGMTCFGQNNQASSNIACANTNYIAGHATSDSGFDSASVFSSFSANTLTINRTNAAGLDYTGFAALLALTGGQVKVGTTNLGTGTSAIDVTSPGFEPDAVIFIRAGGGSFSSPSIDSVNMFFELGFACNDGSDTQACVSWTKRDNVTTGDCRLGVWTGRSLTNVSAFSGNQLLNLVASAFDASGFSITPSASASSTEVAWAALKLASGNAKVITGTAPTSTGNQAYTGVGFRPKFVLIFSTSQTAINPASTINEDNALGASLGISAFNELGDAYAASMQFSDDGVTLCASDLKADIALQIEDNVDRIGSGNPDVRASFVSMDADGFTLNFDQVAASGKYFIALCLG